MTFNKYHKNGTADCSNAFHKSMVTTYHYCSPLKGIKSIITKGLITTFY